MAARCLSRICRMSPKVVSRVDIAWYHREHHFILELAVHSRTFFLERASLEAKTSAKHGTPLLSLHQNLPVLEVSIITFKVKDQSLHTFIELYLPKRIGSFPVLLRRAKIKRR